MKMRTKLLIAGGGVTVLAAAIILGIVFRSKAVPQISGANFEMRGNLLRVELATTPAQMQQGLSGHPKLQEDEGMLFDYGSGARERPGFWMKDMLFDLDILWIRDGRVIGITENIPAPSSSGTKLPVYAPPSEIDAVLEVNAGWSLRHNIRVGDQARFINHE